MKVVFTENIQEDFPVYENIVLVDAADPEEAEKAARQFGIDAEGTSQGTMTWDGKKACLVFAGIRRLVSCVDLVNHANLTGPETKAVGHGTEVTYFQFGLKSAADLDDFLDGKEVELTVIE